MKQFILAFILIVFTNSLFAQDFREVTWGMTKEQVNKVEETIGGILIDNSNSEMSIYSTNFLDKPTTVTYSFIRNKLIEYSFRYESNIISYHALLLVLIEKHGKPTYTEGEKNVWSNVNGTLIMSSFKYSGSHTFIILGYGQL